MPDIKHLLVIAAPVDDVYEAITSQAGVAGWWTAENTTDGRVGGIAEFIFGERYHNKMRIVDLEPGRRIEWECLEGDPEWVGTAFTFDLEPVDDGTLLRFGQNGWREASDFYASCNFQWGFYMRSLLEYCEDGEGSPYQAS